MSLEAMKLALEALEDVQEAYGNHSKWFKDRVDALRQAIEQAEHVRAVNTSQENVDETAKGEHEPVAVISAERLAQMFERFESTEGINKAHSGWQWRMGWNAALRQAMDYTAPPPRQPLTDEHIIGLWQHTKEPDGHRIERFARAIEAAHGITGEIK